MSTEKVSDKKKSNKITRVPVSGPRNVLKVMGLDEDKYAYRFVYDNEEGGARIQRFMLGGYDLVRDETNSLVVGDASVNRTSSREGSLVRVSAGSEGGFLFLMCIDKDLYDEDQAAKMSRIDNKERSMMEAEYEQEGRYGSVQVVH